MRKTTKRTDAHRPGAIVPRDYEYVCSYDCGTFSEPPWGFDELRAHVLANKGAPMFGAAGKCGVCGAGYRYGDLWLHTPSGALVHLGHDCADKYQLVANRDDWSAYLETLKIRRKAEIERLRRNARLEQYYAADPSMRAILEIEHPILQDMVSRVRQWGSLSPKQVELAARLASEAWCPERPKREETKVAAPTGRTVVEGVVVSKKTDESYYGIQTKMTVKVTTPEGVWLCWGSTLDQVEVGSPVRFRATLVAGREPHFAFAKRPHDLRDVCPTCKKRTIRERFCSDECAVEWDVREEKQEVKSA